MNALAKLTAPLLPALVERPHLLAKFDQYLNQRAKVLWIQGPPGAGKTTLTASYLHNYRLRTLWYQLDSGDADTATWFHYLGQVLLRTTPEVSKPLPAFDAAYLADLPGFTRLFFEEFFSRLKVPSVVVFDNYHDLPDEGLHHTLMVEALRKIPPGIQCIITSRYAPPRQFARLIAEQLLIEFPVEELHLDVREIQELLQLHHSNLKHNKAKEWAQHLYQVTRGWVAGVILLGTKIPSSHTFQPETTALSITADIDSDDPILLDYFAQEGLARLSANVQMILLKTAVFPAFTASMAQQISTIHNAGYELKKLVRARYFVENRGGDQSIFQFHPLFKQFLSQQAELQFDSETLDSLRLNAGKLLAREGWIEEAVQVFQDGRLTHQLSTLLLQQAPILLEQGRFQVLSNNLEQLTEDNFKQQPYLYYWLGMSQLFHEPAASLACFEKAYTEFQSKHDPEGIMLAASGAIYAIDFSWTDFKRIDNWQAIINKLWKEYKPLLPLNIQSTIIIAMIRGLFWRHSHWENIRTWIEQAVELTQHYKQLSELTIVVHHIFCISRRFTIIHNIIDETYPVIKRLDEQDFSPPNRLAWLISQIGICWINGAFADAKNYYQSGLEVLNQDEIPVLRGPLLFNGLYAALHDQDLALAEKIIVQIKQYGQQMGPVFLAIGTFQQGWFHALKDEEEQALDYARQSVVLARQTQAIHVESTALLGLAQALVKTGRFDEAVAIIDELDEQAKAIQQTALLYSSLLLRAYIYLETGDHSRSVQVLSEALSLGRQHAIFFTDESWLPDILARLCGTALEADIETDYVRDLSRIKRLSLNSLSAETTLWPWSVRIKTFGSFELYNAQGHVTFSRKSPVMPLRLLKLIICLGGMNVSLNLLGDLLWPDAEGDAAYRSLQTNLARIRKILDEEKVLTVKEGRVSINFNHCWIDCLAFRHLAKSALAEQKKEQPIKAMQLAHLARSLYAAPFLATDDSMREFEYFHDQLAKLERSLISVFFNPEKSVES